MQGQLRNKIFLWTLPLFLASALFAPPSQAATTVNTERRVLVMEVQAGDDVPHDFARALTDLVTGRIAKAKSLEVISSSEIAQVVGLEGKKQLLGCSENACLTEVASTLGARYVVFGRVNALGSLKVVQLRLFDASDARFLQRVTLRGESIEAIDSQVPAGVETLIGGLLDPSERRALYGNRNAPGQVDSMDSGSAAGEENSGSAALWVAGLGSLGAGLLLGAATVAGGLYFDQQINSGSLPYDQLQTTKRNGSVAVAGGAGGSLALIGLGAALLLLGL